MRHADVEVFGDAVNASVLRLPGRKYPGILVQGDSLHTLLRSVAQATEALRLGRGDDAEAELVDLLGTLRQYQAAYEAALEAAGIPLPYVPMGDGS